MTYEEHFERVPEVKDAPIRPYALRDIELITLMAAKFVPQLPSYEWIVVDRERMAYVLRHHQKNSQTFAGWVLVDEKDLPIGCMGASIVPSFLTNDKIANDAWLFVLPNWRTLKNANRLIGAYKAWALAMGATIIKGSCSGGYRPEEMRAFMKRNGFQQSGELFHIRNDVDFLTKKLDELRN